MESLSSPYEVLGLRNINNSNKNNTKECYTDADIGRAYRRASLRAHPDKPGGNRAKFARVKAAYEMLQTQQRRALYQQYGSSMEKSAGHVLGETVDKIIPLVLGLAGGVVCVIFWASAAVHSNNSRSNDNNWNVPILIVILALGGGSLVSYKAPLLEVLLAGVGGILVGGSIGSMVYGLVWLLLSLVF